MQSNECEAIDQFARDYWEAGIAYPEHAADEVLSELRERGALHPEAEARLRAALVDSATEALVSAPDLLAPLLAHANRKQREEIRSYAVELYWQILLSNRDGLDLLLLDSGGQR